MMIITPYSISYSYDYHIPIIIFHIHVPIYDEWWLRFHIKNIMLDDDYTPFVILHPIMIFLRSSIFLYP